MPSRAEWVYEIRKAFLLNDSRAKGWLTDNLFNSPSANIGLIFPDVFSPGELDALERAGVFTKPTGRRGWHQAGDDALENQIRAYNDADSFAKAIHKNDNSFFKDARSERGGADRWKVGLDGSVKAVGVAGTDRQTLEGQRQTTPSNYIERLDSGSEYARGTRYERLTADERRVEAENAAFQSTYGPNAGNTDNAFTTTNAIDTNSPEFPTLYGLGLVDAQGNFLNIRGGPRPDGDSLGPVLDPDDPDTDNGDDTDTTRVLQGGGVGENGRVQRLTGGGYETPEGGTFYQDPRTQGIYDLLRENDVTAEEAFGLISEIGGSISGPSLSDSRNFEQQQRQEDYERQFNLQQLQNQGQADIANTQAGRYGRTGEVSDTGRFAPTAGTLQESDLNRFNQELLARINAGLVGYESGTEAQANRDASLQQASIGANNPFGYSSVVSNAENPDAQLQVLRQILSAQATEGYATNPQFAYEAANQRGAVQASGGLLGYNDPSGSSETLRNSVLAQIRAQSSGGLTDEREIARQQELRSVNNVYGFVQAQLNPYNNVPVTPPSTTAGGVPLGGVTQNAIDNGALNPNAIPNPFGTGGPGAAGTITPTTAEGQSLNPLFPGDNAANIGPGDDPSSYGRGGPPGFNDLQGQTGPGADPSSNALIPTSGPQGQQITPEQANLNRALEILRQTQLAAAAPDIQSQNVNLLSDPSALGAVAAIGGPNAVNQIFQNAGFQQPGGASAGFGGLPPEDQEQVQTDESASIVDAFNNRNIFTDGFRFTPTNPLERQTLSSFGGLSDTVQNIGLGAAAATGQTPNDVYTRLRRNSPSGREGSQTSRFTSI